MLISAALRHKDVTYLNISASKHTWPIVEAQGFKVYSASQFLAIPAFGAPVPGVEVREIGRGASIPDHASVPEAELLAAHAGYGCVSLLCTTAEGSFPFVFRAFERTKGLFRFLPRAQLVYCRDIKDFVRFAGPLGRFLMKRGLVLIHIDMNGPIDGLIGAKRESWPKYYRGAEAPRLGDLAFTELAIFGS
jgi:hypothetical protein